jgi:hypothetical protein
MTVEGITLVLAKLDIQTRTSTSCIPVILDVLWNRIDQDEQVRGRPEDSQT